jgi:hypothetical protein
MTESIVAETVSSAMDTKDMTHDNSGIFETNNIKCSKCLTTKCVYKIIVLIIVLGLGVFMVVYLKK